MATTTGTEIALSSASLEAFAKGLRAPFGNCCVCKKRGARLTVEIVDGIELRVCDHRCAFDLGLLTSRALAASTSRALAS